MDLRNTESIILQEEHDDYYSSLTGNSITMLSPMIFSTQQLFPPSARQCIA